MHSTAYFNDIEAIGGRLYAYGREAELEPGFVMGCTENIFTLIGILESILEDIGDILNVNVEVLGVSDGNSQKYCRYCKECRERLVKVNAFHLSSTISATAQTILVDAVTYFFDIWCQSGLEDAGFAW